MNSHANRLAAEAAKELNLYIREEVSWGVRAYQLVWKPLQDSFTVENPLPLVMKTIASSQIQKDERGSHSSAAAAALLHGTAASTNNGGSIYSVPITHPWVFQPYPGVKLVIGVVCFISSIPVDRALRNYKLNVLGTKYAELTAEVLARGSHVYPNALQSMLAHDVEVDGVRYEFAMDKALEDAVREEDAFIDDNDGVRWVKWCHLESDHYSSLSAITDCKFLRSRARNSFMYQERLNNSD